MKDKKNIDKVFKDGLKNLEASPSPRVWENIQAQLNKEKTDRKVIPLWIRIGGVAALIALLLSVGNWVYDPLTVDSPNVVHENTLQIENESKDKLQEDKQWDEIQIASEDRSVSNDELNDVEDHQNESFEDTNRSYSSDKRKVISEQNSVETVIASEKIKSETKRIQTDSDDSSKDDFNKNINHQEGVATSHNPSQVISTDSKPSKISSERILTNENEEDINSLNTKDNHAIAKEDNSIKAEEQDSKSKVSLLDAIAEQENLKIKGEDKKEQKESLERRWKVTPNVAPVYYSSLGNGSSIDPEFSNSPQSGDVNMSYGVQVSYALNDRLSVRTGLNNVDLSYSTSDIVIATGPVGVGLNGVDYGSRQNVVTAISRATLNSSNSENFGALNLKSTSGDARLIQSINYYEVPLELQYSVIDSRFGVNLIGGVSTLFLGNNEISVKSDNFSSVLGEANNLTSVSFSTNVGLGLNYKLSKKFIFNVEPMFKYQLNPYSDSSVDFKPYYLGVYSGLSYKF